MAAAQSCTHARSACDGLTIVADAATSSMANSSLLILPPTGYEVAFDGSDDRFGKAWCCGLLSPGVLIRGGQQVQIVQKSPIDQTSVRPA